MLLGLPAVAAATPPGRNGSIVFEQLASGPQGETIRTSIRVLNPRTGRVRVLEDWSAHGGATGPSGPTRFLGPPGISSGGGQVAFLSLEGIGSAATVQVVNRVPTGGGDLTRITAARQYWAAPAWFPGSGDLALDGTRDGAAGHGIFRLSPEGRESGPAVAPAAEPDVSKGGAIAYSNGGLYVLRAGVATPRRLVRRGSAPSWSPGGRWLAFQRRTGPEITDTDVFVVRSNGRGLRRVSRRGGSEPAWSPDGRKIVFARGGDLIEVSPTGRRVRRILNLPGLDVDEQGIGAEAPTWQARPRR
jgi:hypothetical protein